MSQFLMTKKVMEHIRFHYLLTEIELCTLVLLELNKFFKIYYKIIKDKSINHNISRIQSDDFIMYWFYCITFIEYLIAGKSFLDYSNLYFSNGNQNNEEIIYKSFKDKYGKRNRKPWLKTKKTNWNKTLSIRINKT